MIRVAVLLLAALLAQPAEAAGGSAVIRRSGPAATLLDNRQEVDYMELQGFACLAAGAASLAAMAITNSTAQVLFAFGGTLLTPVGSAFAATGMVAASFCAVGAIAAPALYRLWIEGEALLLGEDEEPVPVQE